ncbi:hypothetical protein EYC80_003279 [Monilinia laxa]|uniref:Uncharacterized protein n=1 Tax=Monilinia laxa TaxID=61186 RepID=A0A5N6KDE7_MONLA|nr:hypothetical protein EYC80_003279 [Monilinia laxa]
MENFDWRNHVDSFTLGRHNPFWGPSGVVLKARRYLKYKRAMYSQAFYQPALYSNIKSVQTSAVLLLSSLVPTTYAWGTLGHYTVAYVATNFVSTATKSYFQEILGNTSTDYLASVATWSDSYRYTTAGAFSAPFHYIDAQDSPPSSCGVEYSRDCGSSGCVVSAIKNYTTILQKGTASAANLNIAAKVSINPTFKNNY